jgi:hypothetical protein
MKIEKAIVKDILSNLSDRSGIGNELDQVDSEVMAELIEDLERIVNGHLAAAFMNSVIGNGK